MAEASPAAPDALLALRAAIAAGEAPVLTTSPESTTDTSLLTSNIAQATHIQFNHTSARSVLPLNTATRFESDDKAIDLRSIYFAWQSKDQAIPDYIAATQRVSEELQAAGNGERVLNLVFAEKLDLITWLEGASDDSEHIRPLDAEEQAKQAGIAAGIARGRPDGAAGPADGVSGPGRGRTIDPRLREILNGERRMGDRNTVLRGIKATDFSHVRKQSESFITRHRAKGATKPDAAAAPNAASMAATSTAANGSLAQRSKPNRRVEPIILISPSASSLLRMSNIKSFLDDGKYIPPEQGTTDANRLNVSRMLPSIDGARPMRFVLVDTPEMFKPDYWQRVAAVFTTGQTWQFKSYKWQSPPDLFTHALGVYVGWRGEDVPAAVKGWGRGVVNFQIDKWNPHNPQQSRWRDREVVEGIWTAIEESMRNKGMNRDGALTGGR